MRIRIYFLDNLPEKQNAGGTIPSFLRRTVNKRWIGDKPIILHGDAAFSANLDTCILVKRRWAVTGPADVSAH
jgi:hypothetical protein